MANNSLKWLAVLGSVSILASSAMAQDGKAVLDALVKKGVLTAEEAKQITADAKNPVYTAPGSKSVSKISLTGRVQAQYNLVANDADNVTSAQEPLTNSRFSLRRVRLGATADFGKDFRGVISYDMVSNNLDVGYIRWNQSADLTVDAGFRKVNFGFEENTSSARLPAIERSPVTRFFVESNNGRRLGAGSRRTGVFVDGKSGDFFYGGAVTNLDREANPNTPQISGGSQPAFWANAGFKGKAGETAYTVGTSVGYLPEQNVNGTLTSGSLLVTSFYGDVSLGKAGLTAEFLWSDNDRGTGANSWGFHVIPTFNVSKNVQLVVRLSHLDTDGIGTRPSDLVPGALNATNNPGFESVSEAYAGFNYFIASNDVKFSAGVFTARFDDQLGGSGLVKADSSGLRTQMQVNF